LHVHEVFGVAHNKAFERVNFFASSGIFNTSAEGRHVRKAVPVANASHAVAEMQKLLEVARCDGFTERDKFSSASTQKRRDEISEVARNERLVLLWLEHGAALSKRGLLEICRECEALQSAR
jgi:hypothetical protein